MTATKLTLEWSAQQGWLKARATDLTRHIVPPQPRVRCPECHSIVYSRRHPLCGVCGAELPPQLLFSDMESARVAALLKAERERHREWMSKLQGD